MIPRSLPAITTDTYEFWTGGASNELRITRCQACRLYIHPPAPVCRRCHTLDVRAEVVSGRGTVFTYSVNRHPWSDASDEPYVVAVVELDEQPQLYVTTNIIGCPVEEVFIGMLVDVEFEPVGEAHLPLFHPAHTERSER